MLHNLFNLSDRPIELIVDHPVIEGLSQFHFHRHARHPPPQHFRIFGFPVPKPFMKSVQGRRFDLVLSNPPFHQGTDVNTATAQRIVREAFGVLRPGGCLWIVANRFLPYDRVLGDTFGSVATLADDGRYRVLEALRGGDGRESRV